MPRTPETLLQAMYPAPPASVHDSADDESDLSDVPPDYEDDVPESLMFPNLRRSVEAGHQRSGKLPKKALPTMGVRPATKQRRRTKLSSRLEPRLRLEKAMRRRPRKDQTLRMDKEWRWMQSDDHIWNGVRHRIGQCNDGRK